MIPTRLARVFGAFTASLFLANLVLAQEPTPEKGKEKAKDNKGNDNRDNEEKPEIQIELPTLSPPQGDDQQEMVRLFHEVELTLGSIDVELADAGAGRIPLPEGQESGIERLLRSNGAKSDQAVGGIEKILELAQKMSGGGT
jgi:hypothetical protein